MSLSNNKAIFLNIWDFKTFCDLGRSFTNYIFIVNNSILELG